MATPETSADTPVSHTSRKLVRQVALVARELEPVVEDLCQVLGIEVCVHDPGVEVFGLHNAVMPIGSTFLEVVSPLRADASAARLLERRGGDGGYMVIVQTDDLAADRARLDALGVRVVWSVELDDIATIHLHPKDTGGAILSLDAPVPPQAWRWAGPNWSEKVHDHVTTAIRGVTLESDDPHGLAHRWQQVLAVDARPMDTGWRIELGPTWVDFVSAHDGREEALTSITIEAKDAAAALAVARRRGLRTDADGVWVCGIYVRFVPVDRDDGQSP
jgi:hypothetical protein